MKNKKSIKIILLILVLIVLFLVIRSTYSKYVSGTDDQVDAHISKWHILINDNDIMTHRIFSDDIELVPDTNGNIAEGVIVPTSNASFDLEVESTETEVPFEYSIKIAEPEPAKSQYKADFINSWSNGSTSTYVLHLEFEYKDGDNIWYYDEQGTLHYDSPPITLTVPDGFVLDTNGLWWLDNTKPNGQNGNTVTLYPIWWAWGTEEGSTPSRSNNFFSTDVHLTFNRPLDLAYEPVVSGVSLNGETLGTLGSKIPDFRISSYTITETRDPSDINYVAPSTPTPIEVPRSQTTIEGTIKKKKNASDEFIDTTVKYTFHFNLEWYDEDDNTFNNQQDVAISKDSLPFGAIPVEVTVTQIEE